MSTPAMVLTAPEIAGISPRPGVPHLTSAPPPGEGRPAPEGVVPRVTPTPTRGRVIVPLLEGVPAVSDPLPRRHGWRVDHINGAPDAETALRRMFEWARAELAKCEENRPQDADGFRWYLIHRLAPVVGGVYKNHPPPEFLACPPLAGGGWTPRHPKTAAAEARNP